MTDTGRRRWWRSAALLMVLALGLAEGVVAGPAGAQVSHAGVVSPHPVDWTPHVGDGMVHAITTVGDTVVAGGTFTHVRNAGTTQWHDRRALFTFGPDGRVTDLRVDLDGPVFALAPGPGGTVYAGGAFRTVNGFPQRGVTQLDLATGERVAAFDARVGWGAVRAMARHGGWLYLGGTFPGLNGETRPGLARLDAATGAVDPGFDAALGQESGSRVSVKDLALAPDGSRLVAVGGFSHSHGLRRPQMVMMETGGARASLADWYTDAYRPRCAAYLTTYLRGVAFSPDGEYLVAVTTGGMSRPDLLCDTAARFEATGTGMHRPTWVNHTGGDTLLSVAITGAAVYVAGHQRWQDNPQGHKFAGPGAVPREGIAALDRDTGRALPWNPGRSRGLGVEALHATPDGLYVGSDTTRLGGVYRARLGMFPTG